MPNDDEGIQRAGSRRAMSGFTPQAFTGRLPPVEPAWLAARADRPLEGPPRTSRRDRTDEPAPVPPRADKWLCLVTSGTQPPLPAGPGHLLGMSPAQATTGMPLRQAGLPQALAHQEWLPARNADA
jgi:hypothetical protein